MCRKAVVADVTIPIPNNISKHTPNVFYEKPFGVFKKINIMANNNNPWGKNEWAEGGKYYEQNALHTNYLSENSAYRTGRHAQTGQSADEYGNSLLGLDEEKSNANNEEGGIIGTDGRPIKFSFNNERVIKIKSKNVDRITKIYLTSMSLTTISRNVLLEIKDSDIRVEIKSMTVKEKNALNDSEMFSTLSGCTLAKEQYNNLKLYVNGNIDKDKYIENDETFRNNALIRNGSPNASYNNNRIEMLKQEQYYEQVILINESDISTDINPDREFFATTLEESIHCLQDYIETYYKSDNKRGFQDYIDLRHEKEAKNQVNIALIEYDKL